MLEQLADLRAALHRTIDLRDPSSFWACESIVSDAARSGAFREFINEQIALLGRIGTHAPVFTVTIFAQPNFRLLMLPLERIDLATGPSELRDHPEHRIMLNLGPGEMKFTLFDQPQMHEHDVFDRSRPLRACGERTLERFDVLRLEAGRDISDLRVVSEPAVVVALQGPILYETTWTYDAATLLPAHAFSSRLSTTRAEYALAVLAELEPEPTPESLAVVRDLVEHPAHFVRWAAAKTLHRLSEDAGLGSLQRLRNDPHPHVRRAVARSLEALAGGN